MLGSQEGKTDRGCLSPCPAAPASQEPSQGPLALAWVTALALTTDSWVVPAVVGEGCVLLQTGQLRQGARSSRPHL